MAPVVQHVPRVKGQGRLPLRDAGVHGGPQGHVGDVQLTSHGRCQVGPVPAQRDDIRPVHAVEAHGRLGQRAGDQQVRQQEHGREHTHEQGVNPGRRHARGRNHAMEGVFNKPPETFEPSSPLSPFSGLCHYRRSACCTRLDRLLGRSLLRLDVGLHGEREASVRGRLLMFADFLMIHGYDKTRATGGLRRLEVFFSPDERDATPRFKSDRTSATPHLVSSLIIFLTIKSAGAGLTAPPRGRLPSRLEKAGRKTPLRGGPQCPEPLKRPQCPRPR